VSLSFTLGDLEERDARSPIFRQIFARKLVPFNQQRSNMAR